MKKLILSFLLTILLTHGANLSDSIQDNIIKNTTTYEGKEIYIYKIPEKIESAKNKNTEVRNSLINVKKDIEEMEKSIRSILDLLTGKNEQTEIFIPSEDNTLFNLILLIILIIIILSVISIIKNSKNPIIVKYRKMLKVFINKLKSKIKKHTPKSIKKLIEKYKIEFKKQKIKIENFLKKYSLKNMKNKFKKKFQEVKKIIEKNETFKKLFYSKN